jgi:hypothetical protein
MSTLINTTEIRTVNIINGRNGSYRFICKTGAGFMTCTDAREFDNDRFNVSKASILSGYKRGILQTVEFQPTDSVDTKYWLTVFARVGKKVKLIDEEIMSAITIATINGLFDNTNLYNPLQYNAVNAKTWADNAFVMNACVEVS